MQHLTQNYADEDSDKSSCFFLCHRVMDLPGMLRDIPGTVMKYIRELASSFLPGVQMVSDQLLELIRAYVPYEGYVMPIKR